MGYTAVAATILSTATSVVQEQQSAAQAAAMDEYKAQEASNEEQVAQQQAQETLDQGQAEAQQQRQKTRALIGALRASSAANGVTLDSGSALDAQSDDADEGELAAETAINTSEQQAYGQQARAMDLGAESGLDDDQADFADEDGDLALTKSLLGSTPSLANALAPPSQGQALNDPPAPPGPATSPVPSLGADPYDSETELA